jgi:hypothetical protein
VYISRDLLNKRPPLVIKLGGGTPSDKPINIDKMRFNNCYVAQDGDNAYLAIRDSKHVGVVTYQSLTALGNFDKFLAKGVSEFKNVEGAQADELVTFEIEIRGDFDIKDGRTRKRFDIPFRDILDLEIK